MAAAIKRCAGRKLPFGWGERRVAEVVATDVERETVRVVDLDPIGALAVFVVERVAVRSEDFIDDRVVDRDICPDGDFSCCYPAFAGRCECVNCCRARRNAGITS